VIEVFPQCRIPNNKQVDVTLRYVKDTSPVDVDQLSPDGRKLIQDARDIIKTARVLVQEKNAIELFQNFGWHTRDVDVSQARKDPHDLLPIDKSKARDDGQTSACEFCCFAKSTYVRHDSLSSARKHNDYQEPIKWLLSYAEEYAEHGKTVAGHGEDSHAALTSVSFALGIQVSRSHRLKQDGGLKTATSELITLFERFANGQSMDTVPDANKGAELREWFKSLDAYVRKVRSHARIHLLWYL
jgi:hypothetical protein